ncbi:MAG: hypothetical protein Q9188_007373, partial [Gyalolechia gomerana]
MFSIHFSLLLLNLCVSSFAHPFQRRGISDGPVIASNFPDPSFVKLGDTFYAFSTTSNEKNVPIATSTDFNNWAITDRDALPKENLPAWTTGNIWAPDVMQLSNGKFVLYYSGVSKKDTSKHCVGAAMSSDVKGPYIPPNDDEFACPLDKGGAIDASGFIDPSGAVYVTYKIDGNSLGGGGPCGNADGSHHTPIMLQQVSPSDGITPINDPIPILDRDDGDGPLIEAPSLARSADGTYILFFSSNCFNTDLYDISYATASNIEGPYTKSKKPLLRSGDGGGVLKSPGGADVAMDATRVVFHGDREKGDASVREMYVGQLTVDGTT